VTVRDRKSRNLASDMARTDESDRHNEMNIDRNRGEVERLRSGPTGAKMIMPMRIRLQLLLVAVAIGIASRSAGAASAHAYAAPAGSWTTVATFKGDGGSPYDTKPFAVRGRKVRFVYTVQPNSSGPVPLLWQLFREGTSGVKNELGRNSCVSCDGQQTNELGTVPAGSYYLHVITSRPWSLSVEEAQ
jgi:hypothetical protein